MPGILRIIIRSTKFYKKPVFNQVLIISLLCAVITGSLLTGRSVQESLKKSASEHLGNTGILVSTGIRYFDSDLAQRLKDSTGLKCSGIIEINGYCQSVASQKVALNSSILGVKNDFFNFLGFNTPAIKQGEVAINKQLGDYLGIKPGEDLIINFKEISEIPSDAPFAPTHEKGKSLVMKVGSIIDSPYGGNFSLSISQIAPKNIFINLSDLEEDSQGSHIKINRLLVKKDNINSQQRVLTTLKHYLKLPDIGLKLRMISKTGEYEHISDRVFIDESIVKEIGSRLSSSAPVLTYLGNRFKMGSRSTPYSFISALPSSLYPEIALGNGIIINRWMAIDLSAEKGDTIKLFWYSPDSLNNLVEKNRNFIVKDVVEMKGIWSDSLLMPDFPGISGKESCSDWDAGVPIKMHEIRSKDEDYWNKYRGTPKAFISYSTGRELWGNNFGPATAIRYPAGLTVREIEDRLNGSLDPEELGFSLTDLSEESVKAANQGVDFGTLFLGLGFFLILASLVLLSYAASSYFDSKRGHIKTLFALGFKNRWIVQLLFSEAGFISLAGCFIGAFAGYLVNILITNALNSVWNGAVQTDTLTAYFNIWPIISGLMLTFLTIMVFMLIKVKSFLKGLAQNKVEIFKTPSNIQNSYLLSISAIVTISLFVLSVLSGEKRLLYSFSSGTVLLLTLILFWRQSYIKRIINTSGRIKNRKQLSHLYYSFNPSNAITPILFIAAGIFTVFITGANRMNISDKQMKRSGGTGGYLLWCENSIPVKEDLNTESGRKTMGLDDDQLSEMHFVQIKRSSGNDASCLNLNYITVPPLLGINPEDFIAKKSFSFSRSLASKNIECPWQYLNLPSENNTIYGIADQTVLEWGLKLKPGDTLVVRAESGQRLNIIIAAGLQSSVFQGNVLIGKDNFARYYPSVSGSLVLLVDGNRALIELYKSVLNDRFDNYGINIEKTADRLSSFYKVTNTYLSVFGIFGAMGMIIGVAGLGFVLLGNYNRRKHEFALLLATGFNVKKIKRMILSEQVLILFAGVLSGTVSALVATSPSIKNSPDMPWLFIILMIVAIVFTGLSAMFLSVGSVTKDSLIVSLRKE
jgi:putative ABC transport system permease protein